MMRSTTCLAVLGFVIALLVVEPTSAAAGTPARYCHDLEGGALRCFSSEQAELNDIYARTGVRLPTAAQMRELAARNDPEEIRAASYVRSSKSVGRTGSQQSSSATASSELYLTLFDGFNYTGSYVHLYFDQPCLENLGFDNIASSLWVWAGQTPAYIWDWPAWDTGGGWGSIGQNYPDLNQAGFGWNNEISSTAHTFRSADPSQCAG